MKALAIGVALSLFLTGCGQDNSKLNTLEAKLSAAESQAAIANDEQAKLRDDLRKLDDEVTKLKQSNKPAPAQGEAAAGMSQAQVQAEIKAALDALRKELASTKAASDKPVGEKPVEAAQPDKPVDPADAKAKLEETKRKLSELLPSFYANLSDYDTRRKVSQLLWQVDATTRKEVVTKLKSMVAEDPENKTLRMALAEAMTMTFGDVKEGLEQGILAANVLKEVNKAKEIDPDFYDAVHFTGIFKAEYPPGFPEFDEARKDLDKALEMQAKMTWETRFGEVYEAYGKWYLVQKKYEEALAITQAGLDKDARNEDLIALKKRIEGARK